MEYNATVTVPGVLDAGELVDALEAFHPSVGEYPRGHTEIIITLQAETLRQATQAAVGVVETATGARSTRLEVLPTAEFDRRVQSDVLPAMVSVADAAAMLGTSRQAVQQRIDSGSLPAEKVGKTWVLARVTIERLAAKASSASARG